MRKIEAEWKYYLKLQSEIESLMEVQREYTHLRHLSPYYERRDQELNWKINIAIKQARQIRAHIVQFIMI